MGKPKTKCTAIPGRNQIVLLLTVIIAQVVTGTVPVLTCALPLHCVHVQCLFGLAWVSPKARPSFSNFYNTASPWRWQHHSTDISNEPDTPPLGKSLVIEMEEADLASKYFRINNSGISTMKFNIFSCIFHCFPCFAQLKSHCQFQW